MLKTLQQDTRILYYLHEDEGKPKVLELWSENRSAVSYSANKIRDFLVRKAKEEAAAQKAAREEQKKTNYKGTRYCVSLRIEVNNVSLGPIIGHRGDVQRALANQAGLDRLDIHKESPEGDRAITMVGMPYTVAYAKCMIQERLRYRAAETNLSTGHPTVEKDELDEELHYAAYKAVWGEYFSQKALCDYSTVLSNYVTAAAQTKLQ